MALKTYWLLQAPNGKIAMLGWNRKKFRLVKADLPEFAFPTRTEAETAKPRAEKDTRVKLTPRQWDHYGNRWA